MAPLVALVLLGGAAACDSPQRVQLKPGETLPPLPSTIAVRRPTTTAAAPVVATYVVQQGDTLSVIAARVHVDESVLVSLNGILDPDQLQVGQVLQITPSPTTTTTVAPTST